LSYPEDEEEIEDLPSGQLTFTRGHDFQICTLTDDLEQMELEANQFAAELLMPTSACYAISKQQLHRFGRDRPVLARRLATEFLVSKSAMNRRLKDLGLPDSLMMN
jgi:Zn-dependent peptidase ImmA (M78 family)